VSNWLFLVVLGVALLVTFACGTVMLAGAFWWKDPLTTTQQQAFEAANKIFLVGAGSILGLLGGHAT
jgi:hypothetical protein